MSAKKKILLTQTGLHPAGGADAVKTWMLEAILPHYEVTILSWAPVDLDAVNLYYGSNLQQSELTILVPPAWIRLLINAIPGDPWQYQGYSCIMRWCKMIRHRYDILLTTHDETDFGARGIQYVHYPYQEVNIIREPRRGDSAVDLRFLVDWIKTRLRPWRIISGFSFRRMKENLTLVNSEWTGKLFQKIYDSPSLVLYPPIPDDFPNTAWKDRRNGFVCIGRLSAEKKVTDIIDILAEVRTEHPDIHLHIIGFTADYDKQYYQSLQQRIRENSDWIFLHENISRKELTEFVSCHRYGIHAMQNEHFGIAVAEMVCSGSIVFVPDSGGQVEIVGNDPRLLFASRDEAAEKIGQVLADSQKQTALREHLGSRAKLFSKETFTRQLLEIIREFESGAI